MKGSSTVFDRPIGRLPKCLAMLVVVACLVGVVGLSPSVSVQTKSLCMDDREGLVRDVSFATGHVILTIAEDRVSDIGTALQIAGEKEAVQTGIADLDSLFAVYQVQRIAPKGSYSPRYQRAFILLYAANRAEEDFMEALCGFEFVERTRFFLIAWTNVGGATWGEMKRSLSRQP